MKLQKLSILKISPWPKIEYCQWKECKCLKVQDYLEVNIMHLRQSIFPVLIFANAGVWTFCADFFSQMKKILRQNTLINLEPYFDLVFRL